jgi:hypothetical protein
VPRTGPAQQPPVAAARVSYPRMTFVIRSGGEFIETDSSELLGTWGCQGRQCSNVSVRDAGAGVEVGAVVGG